MPNQKIQERDAASRCQPKRKPSRRLPSSGRLPSRVKPPPKPPPPKVLRAKTDEQLFGDFRAAVARCGTCGGTKMVRQAGGRWVPARGGRESGARRCHACKPEQERVFNHWLDRTPPDGKRSWRTRIESFVAKNHKGYQQIVGAAVSEEDIRQDVLLAVWMVWDKYYNPDYLSDKTGRPVKLCTYVWRAIQTAWAKVTERCFCVRNTVYMLRREDAMLAEHQPIYDQRTMGSALAKAASVDGQAAAVAELAAKCRTSHDKRPFTPAILSELVSEANKLGDGNMLLRLSRALPAVARKKRNAVPAHMLHKSLDAPAGDEDDASRNSELVEVDGRAGRADAASADLAAQARAIVANHLGPIDQHILLHCVASGEESIRSVASQYHMTVAETKERLAAVRQWLEGAKRDGLFDNLLE